MYMQAVVLILQLCFFFTEGYYIQIKAIYIYTKGGTIKDIPGTPHADRQALLLLPS